MPPLPPKKPRESRHGCDVQVAGEFGPGTIFRCDVCDKKWIYRPTDLLSGKIATWGMGAVLRILLIAAIVGIALGLAGDGTGWRKMNEFVFTSVVNWLFWMGTPLSLLFDLTFGWVSGQGG